MEKLGGNSFCYNLLQNSGSVSSSTFFFLSPEKKANCGVAEGETASAFSSNLHFQSIYLRGKERGRKRQERETGRQAGRARRGAEDPSSFTEKNSVRGLF